MKFERLVFLRIRNLKKQEVNSVSAKGCWFGFGVFFPNIAT